MKLKQLICALGTLVPSAVVWASSMPVEYFPPKAISAFDVNWFGESLVAADEPSLYQLAKKDQQAAIYRLTIYPPFTDVIILRLEEQKDGSGILNLTRINQGSGPWHRKAKFFLTQAGMAHFHKLMDQINFWHLDTELKNEEVIEDGTEFVYEGVRAGRYHIAERVYPTKNAAYYAPAFYFLKLAGEPTEGI